MSSAQAFFQQLSQAAACLQQIPLLEYRYNPRQLIHEIGKVKLFHYQNKKPSCGLPVLIVFAMVNRPEILDLMPERSFIHGLLAKGVDVYLLDWGYPDVHDAEIPLAYYVESDLHGCVNKIISHSGHAKVNLLGICQGGVLCLSYAALFSTINKLVLISTPVDFSTQDNVIANILRKFDVSSLERLSGNIPGEWLKHFFISLRPFELLGKKYLRFMDEMEDADSREMFLRVEKWLHDAPDQPRLAFLEFVKGLYLENRLVDGKFSLGGKLVDLGNIQIPVLNVMGKQDEIVPVSASLALRGLVKDYKQKIFSGGHIGIYLSKDVTGKLVSYVARFFREL